MSLWTVRQSDRICCYTTFMFKIWKYGYDMNIVEEAVCRSVRRFKVTEYVTQLYSCLRYGVVETAICRSVCRFKLTEYVAILYSC